MIYSVAASGLDVLSGYCGQISLGHAAYFAIGAYMSACLTRYFGLPVVLTMLIGSVTAAAVGAIIAYPTTKLVFHFLALATISFGAIVNQAVRVSPGGITGDAIGFVSAPLEIFGISFDDYGRFYLFALGVLILTLVIKNNLVNSRWGRAFIAIRENSHAADGMGINVRAYKVIAFATSTFFAGFAGAMFAHLVRFIIPDQFQQVLSVYILTMLMFGGTGSIAGPIIGVICVQLLTEALRFAEAYQMLIYGALLLLVIVVFPGGMYGILQRNLRVFQNLLRKQS
jgi:branched-chain amino acid transport system permease protein